MPHPISPRRNASGLARDLEILELLGSPCALDADGLGVSDVARATGRDKAVASRTLATLADAGFLERDPQTRAYRLGTRVYALAALTADARLARASQPILRRVALRARETTHLCVLRGGNVLTIASVLSPDEFRATGWEGVTTAAWRTPSGRALLSDWDDEAVAIWYAEHGRDQPIVGPERPRASRFSVHAMPPSDRAVVTDFDSFRRELDRIRREGVALLEEEWEAGVVGASAPVRDFTGRIVAALNVSAPAARIGPRLPSLARFVAMSARELSRELGSPASVAM